MPDALILALLAAAGLLLLAIAAQYATVFGLLLRQRFRSSDWQPVARDALQDDVRLLLDGAAPALEALDFRYVGSATILPPQASGDPDPIQGDYYRHREQPAFAFVHPAEHPEPGALTVVSFETLFDDGTALTTVNRRRHLMLPLPEGYRLEDAESADLAGQWDHHRRRLSAFAVPAVSDPDELWRHQQLFHRSLVPHWRHAGVLRDAEAGRLRLTPGAAWRHLRQIQAGERRLRKRPASTGDAPLEQRVAADLRAFRANESLLQSGAFSRAVKVLFFAASAAAAALAFGLVLSWHMVPILIGVLLFHELGHALAMRITGYRGLGVLVIPLLGAVAIGRKDDAGPWQKLFVLLAGPLPGLVLAVACLQSAVSGPQPDALLLEVGAVALGLNLFNLLPVMPLDGGQIVETFLFAHFPRLRIAFAVASWLALGALGLRLDSHVLMAVAGIMALGGPGLLRRMSLAARVGTVPVAEAPRAAFAALHRQPALARRPFRQRLMAVRGALPFIVGRRPRAWESAACLAVYLAAVGLPVLYLLELAPFREALASAWEHPVESPSLPVPDWDERLAGATTPEARWQVLFEAGQWYEEVEDEANAVRRYREALVLARGFTGGDLRLLDNRMALLRLGDEAQGDPVRAYRALLPELRALQGEQRRRLAEGLEALHWLEDDAPASVRIAHLREAIAVRTALPEEHRYALLGDRRELALLLDRQGDSRAAEAELRANLGAACDGRYGCPGATVTLAWFLMTHERGEEAEALLLESVPDQGAVPPPQAEALAWARIDRGNLAAARTGLKASLTALPTRYSDWALMSLLLDLIHASSGDAGQQAHWLEKARTIAAAMDPQVLKAFGRHLCAPRHRDYWQAPRDRARRKHWRQVVPPEQASPPEGLCP